jgi:hypothetical protein
MGFQASVDKKVCETPYLNGNKLSMVVCTCHPNYSRKLEIG